MEVNSDNALEFNSKISFGEMEERVQLDSESAWYIVPKVGINLPGDMGIGPAADGIKVDFDSGLSIGLAIGVEMSNNFSLQFDIGYMKNDVDTLKIDGVGIDPALFGGSMEMEQMPIMLSAIWNGSGSNIQPYAGFGLGTTHGEFSVDLDATLFGTPLTYSEDEWAFTYQAIAGIKFELSPSADMSIDYRFLHADYDGGSDLDNHTISLGLQFRF
jgi:opacity protein-like surface antigen